MQFQVPQFIEIEDKIVGPFTLKQFMYLAGAIGISFILFFMVENWVWFLLSVPTVSVGIGMAFLKINGQSFQKVITSAAHYYWNPQTYVWQPNNPLLLKTEENLEKEAGGLSLEKLVTGVALKSAWKYVQTGSRVSAAPEKISGTKYLQQRFQIYQKITGERRAAKRIDYR